MSIVAKIKHKLGYWKYLRALFYFYYYRRLPLENKVVISQFVGKGYGDSPKYIANQLHLENPEVQIVWLVKRKYDDMPKWIRQIEMGDDYVYTNKEVVRELSTARVWIDNVRKHFTTRKRNGQLYIQTWHGCIALKKIEAEYENLNPHYVMSAKRDSQMIDLLVSNSEWTTRMYRNCFWYKGRILECGTPRCDILMNTSSDKANVKNQYGIGPKDKVVLYAPTFRNDDNFNYNLNYDKLRLAIESSFGYTTVLLIRLHPNVSSRDLGIKYDSKIINASQYPDIMELMSEADILITDYSSTMFEFSLMNKPVFLYCKDIEEYENDRPLHFKISNLPFPLASNETELINNIKEFDEKKYLEDLSFFNSYLNLKESGNASKILTNHIVNHIYRNS